MCKSKLEVVRDRCGVKDRLCVDCVGHSGGIGLWWRDFDVHLVSFSSHHVLVEIKDNRLDSTSLFACGVYGWADRPSKYKTWDLIQQCMRSFGDV